MKSNSLPVHRVMDILREAKTVCGRWVRIYERSDRVLCATPQRIKVLNWRGVTCKLCLRSKNK